MPPPPQRTPRPPPPPRASADPSAFPSFSPWAAPQSHIPPPTPPSDRQPSDRRAETYLRRVTQPDRFDGPRPTPLQRGSQLLAGGLSLLAVGWLVLWQDYGDGEHCFSPIRRLAGTRSIPIFKQELTPDQEHMHRGPSAISAAQNKKINGSGSLGTPSSASSKVSTVPSSQSQSQGEDILGLSSLLRGAQELRQGKAKIDPDFSTTPRPARRRRRHEQQQTQQGEDALRGASGTTTQVPGERQDRSPVLGGVGGENSPELEGARSGAAAVRGEQADSGDGPNRTLFGGARDGSSSARIWNRISTGTRGSASVAGDEGEATRR